MSQRTFSESCPTFTAENQRMKIFRGRINLALIEKTFGGTELEDGVK